MDARGRPVMVWSEFDGHRRFLAVQAWDGSRWQPLGEGPGVLVPASSPSWPAVAVDRSGRPVVAWTDTSEDGSDRDVYVSRWDGQGWVPIGMPLHAYSGYLSSARAPSLALDAAGNPVVAWLEHNGRTDDVLVRRWNGKDWQPVGEALTGFSGTESQAGPVSLVLDPRDRPLVAWQAGWSFVRVLVRGWDGSAWQPLGEPLRTRAGGTAAVDPSLALAPDGTPYLAWTELDFQAPSQVHVRTWDGSTWRPLREQEAGAGIDRARQPRLSVDSSGVPRLAWVEWGSSVNGLIHLGRWTGTAWEPETPAAYQGQAPALAVSPRGRPFLAWLERNGANGLYGVFVQSPGVQR